MPAGFYGAESTGWQLAGLTLSESVYPANLRMPAHRHEPAYCGLVLNGGYAETVGRKTCHRKPLTIVFHPQGEAHAVAFHSAGARIFRVELSQGWHERTRAYAEIPDEPAEFQGGLLASLLLRLYNEYRNRDAWSPMAAEGLTLEIMAAVARCESKSADAQTPRWLEQAREILASRLSETLALADLAAEVGVHPVHLARAWRKRFNCTVGDFVRQLRVEMACAEIAGSDAPLCEIALAAGFYDQSHFCNTFKRFTGMTPAAYRAVLRAR